jgi:hypothetical protein
MSRCTAPHPVQIASAQAVVNTVQVNYRARQTLKGILLGLLNPLDGIS